MYKLMRIINQLRNQHFNIIYLKYTNFKILLLTIMRQSIVVYHTSALKSVLEMHEIQFIFFFKFFSKMLNMAYSPRQSLNNASIQRELHSTLSNSNSLWHVEPYGSSGSPPFFVQIRICKRAHKRKTYIVLSHTAGRNLPTTTPPHSVVAG